MVKGLAYINSDKNLVITPYPDPIKAKEEEARQPADPVPAARSQRVCAGQERERWLVDHGSVTQGDEDGCSVMEKHVGFLEEFK